MLTYFRINYWTNLTYFPIFSHYVDFSKVAAASHLAAAAEPQPQIVLRFIPYFFLKDFDKLLDLKRTFEIWFVCLP